MNAIESVYESTFDLHFVITHQNVWTTSNTPYTQTEAGVLLRQFTNHWNANNQSISRDIVHLFTGKDLDGGIIGIGWRPGLERDYAYAVSMNRNEMYETTAHEIGHNLNAAHPSLSSCECNKSSASVMCQGEKSNSLWFCEPSREEIAGYIYEKRYQLGRPNVILTGTVTGNNSYETPQSITSTQIIASGSTSYKATEQIVLDRGFEVKPGAEFSLNIEQSGGCFPIFVEKWISIACRGKAFQLHVENATYCNITVYNTMGQTIYEAGKNITSGLVTLWNVPSSTPTGVYVIYITFSSDDHEISKSYQLFVTSC